MKWNLERGDEIDIPKNIVPDIEEVPSLSQEQKREVRELMKQTKFFILTDTKGGAEIDGVATYHYRFALNQNTEEIKTFFIEIDRISGGQFSRESEEFASLMELIDSIDNLSGEMWIGKRDFMLYRFIVSLDLRESENWSALSLNADITFKNFNHPVVIEAPNGARDPVEVFEEWQRWLMQNALRKMNQFRDEVNREYARMKIECSSGVPRVPSDTTVTDWDPGFKVVRCGPLQGNTFTITASAAIFPVCSVTLRPPQDPLIDKSCY